MNKKIVIDLSNCEYIGSVHKEIAKQLDLPNWYGENLDALWDSLTGIIETPIEIKIIYKPQTQKAKALRAYVNQVLTVFKDAEFEYKEIHITTDIERSL